MIRSHALFHSWAHEPEGGWSGANVSVSHIVGPGQGSGLMGLLGSRWVPSGHVRVLYGSVYQSNTNTGQSSDTCGLVGSRRAKSVSDGFPSEPCFGTMGPDKARRIARLSRIDARLMYGPPGHTTASPRVLWGLVGTQRTPGGPPGGTVGPGFIGASSVWAFPSSYWRQPGLL